MRILRFTLWLKALSGILYASLCSVWCPAQASFPDSKSQNSIDFHRSFAFRLPAETPETVKKWTFEGKNGTVELDLSRFTDKDGATATTLEIYSANGGARSVAEESRFLEEALNDFQKSGIAPQSLNWISFRFSEPEAVSRVAKYAAQSKQWRDALKTAKESTIIYPLMTSFLNDSQAYRQWVSVFRKHGLVVKIVGVEKVIMEPFAQVGIPCPAGRDCKDLVVPRDALVQMNVYPLGRSW